MPEFFTTNLTVDKNIVPLLSRSTYVNFPTAIRELISNAHDADATTVEIHIDLTANQLVVKDDGNGMTTKEFELFLKIAGQKKRRSPKTQKFGRTRIGQFGVGFLAAFPYCKTLQIVSTAENSDEIFSADIPAESFFAKDSEAKDVASITVQGSLTRNPKITREHFTEIRLIGLTPLVKRYFEESKKEKGKGRWSKISMSIKNCPPMQRLEWELQEDLPISFKEGSVLASVLSETTPVPLLVSLNGKQLVRNEIPGEVLAKGKDEVDGIRYAYVITTPWEPIHPKEARFLKIRLNNVGVGERDAFDVMGIRQWSRYAWLTGEVHLLSGMGEHISLDRNGFVWNRAWEEFRNKMRAELAKQLYYVEEVDTGKKELETQFNKTAKAKIGASEEVFARNLDTFKKHGFEVIRHPKDSGKHDVPKHVFSKSPIEVDVKKKKVYLNADFNLLKDSIMVGKDKYFVEYSGWDVNKNEFPACRITSQGVIQINSNYFLFKSRKYGDLFRKIHIALLIARLKTGSPKEMYAETLRRISEMFKDY